MSSVNNAGFGTRRTMGRTDSLGLFKRKVTKYIIDVDFYIVTSRLISLTDSFNIIIYLLLKQNPNYSAKSLRTLFLI